MGHAHCDQICRNFATLAKFTSIWQIFDSLFLIWQIAEPIICDIIGPIFIVANVQILKNISNHLVTLVVRFSTEYIFYGRVTCFEFIAYM